MNIFINLFVSLIHFILAYGIFITALISNDLKILLGLLILMSLVKISFYLFGRCILTLFEYNDYFASTAKLLTYTLTSDNPDKKGEEILVNIGMLIITNKIFALLIYNYYKNII